MGCCSICGLSKEDEQLATKRTIEKTWLMILLGVLTGIVLILCLIIFILQIYSIAVKGPLYYVAVGIWGSLMIVIAKVPAPFLIWTRFLTWNNIYSAMQLLSLFGCLAISIVNIVAEAVTIKDNPYLWINGVQLALATLIGVCDLAYIITYCVCKLIIQKELKESRPF